MMTVTVEPRLLQWARERASLSPAELARKVGISRVDRVEGWLSTGELPFHKLEQIAAKTYVPVGYLFLAEPPLEPMPVPDFRTVADSRIGQPSPELIDTLYTCERRQDWYREYLEDQGVEALPFLGRFTLADQPSKVAFDIRETIGWDANARTAEPNIELAVGKLASAIEEAGVLVMRNGVVGNNNYRPLNPQEFRGFAMFDPLAPLIFVNAADSKAAQMFTLAHELAHIWIGNSALLDVKIDSDRPAERFCNKVAAELLVPATEFLEAWRGLDDEGLELQRLSRQFRVSRFVILIRALESGLINESEYKSREDQERGREFRTTAGSSGGNFYLTQRSRLGRRFAKAVILSAKSGRTLVRDAYELLSVKKEATFKNLADVMEVA